MELVTSAELGGLAKKNPLHDLAKKQCGFLVSLLSVLFSSWLAAIVLLGLSSF